MSFIILLAKARNVCKFIDKNAKKMHTDKPSQILGD